MSADRIVLEQADSPPLVATARELFLEYAQAIATDLEYQGFTAELSALPEPYIPPWGALLVATARRTVAGCVAVRPLGGGIAEMKRLYVRPACRGMGLGQTLVQAAIDVARRVGHTELRLDTLPTMTSAQALYARLGFVEIPSYNTASLPGTRFYALPMRVPDG